VERTIFDLEAQSLASGVWPSFALCPPARLRWHTIGTNKQVSLPNLGRRNSYLPSWPAFLWSGFLDLDRRPLEAAVVTLEKH
jgi:hypothetical protein